MQLRRCSSCRQPINLGRLLVASSREAWKDHEPTSSTIWHKYLPHTNSVFIYLFAPAAESWVVFNSSRTPQDHTEAKYSTADLGNAVDFLGALSNHFGPFGPHLSENGHLIRPTPSNALFSQNCPFGPHGHPNATCESRKLFPRLHLKGVLRLCQAPRPSQEATGTTSGTSNSDGVEGEPLHENSMECFAPLEGCDGRTVQVDWEMRLDG